MSEQQRIEKINEKYAIKFGGPTIKTMREAEVDAMFLLDVVKRQKVLIEEADRGCIPAHPKNTFRFHWEIAKKASGLFGEKDAT